MEGPPAEKAHPGTFFWLPEPFSRRQRVRRFGQLGQGSFLPFLFQQFTGGLFKELRCGPLIHVEVVLDVAVAQHEVLADLDGGQVRG